MFIRIFMAENACAYWEIVVSTWSVRAGMRTAQRAINTVWSCVSHFSCVRDANVCVFVCVWVLTKPHSSKTDGVQSAKGCLMQMESFRFSKTGLVKFFVVVSLTVWKRRFGFCLLFSQAWILNAAKPTFALHKTLRCLFVWFLKSFTHSLLPSYLFSCVWFLFIIDDKHKYMFVSCLLKETGRINWIWITTPQWNGYPEGDSHH